MEDKIFMRASAGLQINIELKKKNLKKAILVDADIPLREENAMK